MRFLFEWLVGLNIYIEDVICKFYILISSPITFFLMRTSPQKFLILSLPNFILQMSIVSLIAGRGTFGYIGPGLFYKNIGGISYKTDVYSFGKLLLEMTSRRKNFNAFLDHSSQIYFPTWVFEQVSRGNDMIMEDAIEEEKNIVNKMIVVTLWCIQMKPSDRCSMNKVVEMLVGEV